MVLQTVKQVLKSYLPEPVKKPISAVYSRLKPAVLAPDAVTVYLNTTETSTTIGINNIYSWLAPEVRARSTLVISFYDHRDGRLVLEHRKNLAYFAVEAVDVRALFAQQSVMSEMGMFALRVEPDFLWRREYQQLGRLAGIFFTLYQNRNGSISVVHPNARLGGLTPPEQREWHSLHLVSTQGLKAVNLYQMHCMDYSMTMTYTVLCNRTGNVLAAQSAELKPRTTTRFQFEVSTFKTVPAEIRLKTNVVPPNNSKAVLERVYVNGQTSLSHS